ncbi:cTAGE family member 2-like [Cavia porcellus]|uniref:cTAGE family member 2-like n=1 Tax=Cavia porcellus TaxID=10141 RepID=UPI002FE38BD1
MVFPRVPLNSPPNQLSSGPLLLLGSGPNTEHSRPALWLRQVVVHPCVMDWEITVGLLTLVLISWRTFLSIRSRLGVWREKRLALQLAERIKEKCQLLDELRDLQKEHKSFESALKKVRLEEEARRAQRRRKAAHKKVLALRNRAKIQGQIHRLLKKLTEKASECFRQQQSEMADVSNKIRSPAEKLTSKTSKIANRKLALWSMHKKRLQREMTDDLTENGQLHESHSQLSHENQRWKEREAELTSRKRALQDSQARGEQLLREKGKHFKALTQRLIIITNGWASGLPEDTTQTENSQQEVESHLENGPGSGHRPRVPLEKLVYGAGLNASLKNMAEQRNQLRTQLGEAEKTKKELQESLYHLQTQKASLESANAQLGRESHKLQEKVVLMEEIHRQTLLHCHTKQRQQAKAWAEQGKKLTIREAEVSLTAKELETYRKMAQDMQEEGEKTIQFHQRQVTCMQKKAREYWDAAATAGRLLRDVRRGNAHTKVILRAMEMKAPLLGQDPATLSAMKRSAGRQHCLPGPFPRGRPAPARRSAPPPLPTLWEEPLAS